jgi:hypothetical protein
MTIEHGISRRRMLAMSAAGVAIASRVGGASAQAAKRQGSESGLTR